MDVRTLIEAAEGDELHTLAAVIKRVQARPAVLVWVANGRGPRRRYVVAQEDEERIRALMSVPREDWPQWDYFGAQWLRGYGRVDEMYRSLNLSEVLAIAEADAAKVLWGD